MALMGAGGTDPPPRAPLTLTTGFVCVQRCRLRLRLSGVGRGNIGADHDEVQRRDQRTGSEELATGKQRRGSTRAERSGLLWLRPEFSHRG